MSVSDDIFTFIALFAAQVDDVRLLLVSVSDDIFTFIALFAAQVDDVSEPGHQHVVQGQVISWTVVTIVEHEGSIQGKPFFHISWSFNYKCT